MTCSYSKEFSSSAFTDVENAFITEYLPVSSGDAVKVYLYGLFLCQNPKFDRSIAEIASTLDISQDKILEFFEFWEEFGLVSIVSKEPFSVQYLPIRSSYSAKPKKIKAEKYTEFTKGLQALLPDRMISTSEYTEYFTIMETYGIKPEAMLMIVKYCADRKGTDIGYRYVSKVAKDFGNRGIVTVEKVEKELSSYIMRTGVIERILKALSLRRQPEIEDSTLLKKWTQELNFETENIVFAASKLKKGSMAKLDEFLIELYSMKSFSKEEIAEYMDKKQTVYDLAIKINKALSIYVDVIDTVVDNYTKKWLSYGFDQDTLLYIANHCFKSGKNTLQDMDDILEYLRARGFIDLSSVSDYFENLKKSDEFLSKMLLTAGVNRRPTPWDRENLNMWKTWNFSEDMILEAAKLASGKSSPTAYMNGILSNWKNNGVFTLNGIPDKSTGDNNSQEEYNREYERRRALAVSRAQKNIERATAIDGFMDVYGRLNGMEKDLAFAEIAGDEKALTALEKEKQNLISRAEEMLKTIGIALIDLSPRYACEKCNDTGYVGTHRCDCYDKK
ncbi:MAG: DnaD domain protein [Clostridia bacterium]|nr:DnaD domain protein [Clostridia bacterium]